MKKLHQITEEEVQLSYKFILMKKLHQITEEEVKHICQLLNEPYLGYMVNDDGEWDSLKLEVQIHTTSTLNGDRYDSSISIYEDGKITLWRNDGGWDGSRYEPINTVPVIDYLRSRGYNFIFC